METVESAAPEKPLYPRQAELMVFVHTYQVRHQRPPSTREMMEAMGVRSTNSVAELVAKLRERGLVERMPRSARSIRLTWRGRKALEVLRREKREAARAKSA